MIATANTGQFLT